MSRFAAILTVLALAAFAAVGCKKKPDTAADTGAPGSDKERLQGTWGVESFDDGEPLDPGELEGARHFRLHFAGDKLTVSEGGGDTFTFALDENQNPKVMTLTEVVDASRPRGFTSARGTGTKGPPPAREPEKLVWIYKFDGDALVVAFLEKGQKPSAFKGGEGPDGRRVIVLTLKKPDAPPPPRRSSPTTMRSGTRK